MSSLIVEVSQIDSIKPHSNADKLELCEIKGWQVCVPKGKYAPGVAVAYIPPDCVLPVELSDRIGITKYLSKGRVRCAKLRGEPSFGVVMDVENPDWTVGTDVAAHYGITKYIPPVKLSAGDAEADDPLFARYTEIENMRNFPDVIREGEEVVVTEKIHGGNCRVGLIEGAFMAGSKAVRRKQPQVEQIASNLYWHPLSMPGVCQMLESFRDSSKQVILFGEVYGKVQSLRYGITGIAFRAFDLMVDGRYLDYDRFAGFCHEYGVDMVPLLYRGKFSLDTVKQLSAGRSVMPGADHIREGVVCRPAIERNDPKIGRVCLKYINDAYLLGDETDTNDE